MTKKGMPVVVHEGYEEEESDEEEEAFAIKGEKRPSAKLVACLWRCGGEFWMTPWCLLMLRSGSLLPAARACERAR
eukprot:COSAG01_NODE_550_length_15593_cov_12.422422_3_plen_76_part_00